MDAIHKDMPTWCAAPQFSCLFSIYLEPVPCEGLPVFNDNLCHALAVAPAGPTQCKEKACVYDKHARELALQQYAIVTHIH